MRKILISALVVFALAFTFALLTAEQPQAASNCWFTCGTCGVPLQCCKSGGVTTCRVYPNSPLHCTRPPDC